MKNTAHGTRLSSLGENDMIHFDWLKSSITCNQFKQCDLANLVGVCAVGVMIIIIYYVTE